MPVDSSLRRTTLYLEMALKGHVRPPLSLSDQVRDVAARLRELDAVRAKQNYLGEQLLFGLSRDAFHGDKTQRTRSWLATKFERPGIPPQLAKDAKTVAGSMAGAIAQEAGVDDEVIWATAAASAAVEGRIESGELTDLAHQLGLLLEVYLGAIPE